MESQYIGFQLMEDSHAPIEILMVREGVPTVMNWVLWRFIKGVRNQTLRVCLPVSFLWKNFSFFLQEEECQWIIAGSR